LPFVLLLLLVYILEATSWVTVVKVSATSWATIVVVLAQNVSMGEKGFFFLTALNYFKVTIKKENYSKTLLNKALVIFLLTIEMTMLGNE